MNDATPSTALDDVTALDLTRVRAGPACVRQFADWGAEVIKIKRRRPVLGRRVTPCR